MRIFIYIAQIPGKVSDIGYARDVQLGSTLSFIF